MAGSAGNDDSLTGASPPQDVSALPNAATPPLWLSLVRLARPNQWTKSAFVLVGPFYALKDLDLQEQDPVALIVRALIAAAAFALVSSACYVVNDIFDRVADRAHPRKRRRPLASGAVSTRTAWIFASVLFVAGIALILPLRGMNQQWVALTIGLYVINVMLYSAYLKHKVIADVISLSLGFVLRVMGGCAAAGVEPSVWLLNVTFFLSMFLAFGKRLGERRTLGAAGAADPLAPIPGRSDDMSRAVEHRRVHAGYTDSLLQMAVMVSAVITLMTYALYVKDLDPRYTQGFNLMWLTMLPAFYGLFRCVVLIERGRYDDPTELATRDRGFQAAGAVFLLLTIAFMWWFSPGATPTS